MVPEAVIIVLSREPFRHCICRLHSWLLCSFRKSLLSLPTWYVDCMSLLPTHSKHFSSELSTHHRLYLYYAFLQARKRCLLGRQFRKRRLPPGCPWGIRAATRFHFQVSPLHFQLSIFPVQTMQLIRGPQNRTLLAPPVRQTWLPISSGVSVNVMQK